MSGVPIPAFPGCIDYNNTFYSIPEDTISYEQVSTSNNGSSFANGSTIQVDMSIEQFSCIEPSSIIVNYKDTTTNTSTAYRLGCPFATPFSKFEMQINGQSKETIQQYNQVYTLLTNTIFDQAQKSGMASCLGYCDLSGNVIDTLANLNGRTVGVGEIGSYSGPLLCTMLTNCTNLIPMGKMGTVRLIFTVDTLANMFGGTIPANYSIYNFEVRYKVIRFPQHYMDRAFKNDKIFLKTMSFQNSSVPLASGTTGTISLIYNQRFNSIKALFLHPSGTTSYNKNFDSFDITGSNGSTATSQIGGNYQFLLGGKPFPQKALDTLNNKSAIIMELRNALGSMYQPNNSMSIEPSEFANYVTNSTTTMQIPSKFYIGTSTEKLHVNYGGEFMSGQGTNNQPITVTINTSTATAQALNVNLIILYDVIMEIDLVNQQVNCHT